MSKIWAGLGAVVGCASAITQGACTSGGQAGVPMAAGGSGSAMTSAVGGGGRFASSSGPGSTSGDGGAGGKGGAAGGRGPSSSSSVGGCAKPCSIPGQTCQGGHCACPSSEIVCGGACVDDQTDGKNCGACGKSCLADKCQGCAVHPDAQCKAGTCTCAGGEIFCPVSGCVDDQTDRGNCGGCSPPYGAGKYCPGNGGFCHGGACACPPGQTVCDPWCVDEQRDSNNCGSCGKTCSGACYGAKCQDPVVLAATPGGGNIVVDATSVYWTTATGNNGTAVMKCATSGCGANATVLASSPTRALGLAVDATSVYWTNVDDGTVLKCAISGCGGAPTILASGQNRPWGIAVDGTSVYWTTYLGGTVGTCAIGGCPAGPTILASGQGAPMGIAVDLTNVYWTTSGPVMKCAIGGCGGNPTMLAPGQNGSMPTNIAVEGTTVYWTTTQEKQGLSPSALMKCAASGCGGNPTTLWAPLGSALGSIAVDATNVYGFEGFAPQVYVCPTSGCALPGVLVGEGGGGIALDATSIYWTGAAGVMKLAKP